MVHGKLVCTIIDYKKDSSMIYNISFYLWELLFIYSTGGNYRLASWSGISGEPFYGFASAADGDELI